MSKFERLERKVLHEGKITTYCKDLIKLPNGNQVEWDFVQHNGAAAIVPVLEDGRIVLVRQYRPSIDCETLEIPAGGFHPGEDPKLCAIREMEEETGYRCEDATHLIDLFTTVAFCNEKIYIYMADIKEKGVQCLDEDEFVHVELYTVNELNEMILNGKIQDAKTISAILAYEKKVGL